MGWCEQPALGVCKVNVGVLNADGTQVFCDAAGANLPVVPLTSSAVATIGNVVVSSAALDGGGNLWFTTTNTPTGNAPTSSTKSGLSGMDPTGKLLTPFSLTTGVLGLQYLSAQVVGENANLAEELAVDAYGNLWYISGNSLLVKIPGLTMPKQQQPNSRECFLRVQPCYRRTRKRSGMRRVLVAMPRARADPNTPHPARLMSFRQPQRSASTR